jgi:hypothetical protein
MAENERFTPGPYEAVLAAEGLFHIHSPRGDRKNPVPLAVVDHHRDGHEPTRTVTTPANAHLLAASWEMYQALKAVRNFTLSGDEDKWEPVEKKVRAALAKARGDK